MTAVRPSRLQVVVLAAGQGLRLEAVGNGRAKALLEVGGRTLVERAIGFADSLGAERTVIVGGCNFDELGACVAALAHPRITVLENRGYCGGNLATLRAALPHVDASVLLTNVDHLFAASALPAIAAAMGSGITAYCQFARPVEVDEMKVDVDAARNVRRIAKTLERFDGAYIGLTYIPSARNREWQAAIARASASHRESAVAEHALQELADHGVQVRAASVDGIHWCEVDTPGDYARAEAMCAAGYL